MSTFFFHFTGSLEVLFIQLQLNFKVPIHIPLQAQLSSFAFMAFRQFSDFIQCLSQVPTWLTPRVIPYLSHTITYESRFNRGNIKNNISHCFLSKAFLWLFLCWVSNDLSKDCMSGVLIEVATGRAYFITFSL